MCHSAASSYPNCVRYTMAWPRLPLLSTLNALPLLGFLTFSRKSRTREEWSFRHSLWHFFLALDMPFFLVTLG